MLERLLTYNKYKQAVQRLFNTEDGHLVLAYWKLDRIDQSAFSKTPEETYAKLAIKEFVQGILNDVKNPEKVDEIIYSDQGNE